MFPVIIPSKGRAGKMLVMKKVVPELKGATRIYVAVEPAEAEEYQRAYPELELLILPDNNQGIGFSRRYIQESFKDEPYLMIDDDCEGFSKRSGELTAGGYPRLKNCSAVEAAQHLFEKAATHGISCCSHKPQNWLMKDPPNTMLMWNTVCVSPALLQKGVAYDQGASGFEDYEITAQALITGFSPYMSPFYAFNTSLAIGVLPGGLQCFDREALQEKSIAHILEKWGEEYVKVIVNPKSGRREVRFRWAKLKQYEQTKKLS
jgi:hypothetical protein